MKNSKPEEPVNNRIVTIPNILSVVRILLIPPFVILFLRKMYLISAIIVVLSGLTDFVDGFIARRFHQESELGKILDPLADKLTLIAVGLCLIYIEPFVLPLMVILVGKDVLMLIGGSYIIRNGVIPPHSNWYGKLGTTMFYVTVIAIVAMKVVGYENRVLAIVMLSLTAAMMIFSLIMYARVFFRLNAEIRQKKQTQAKN